MLSKSLSMPWKESTYRLVSPSAGRSNLHSTGDEEDFELTVSSAGIGYPFKVEQQYQKNLGKSVEIKLNDHTKLNGILLRFTPEEIVIEQEEKKIIEGSKRKQLVKTERTIVRKDIKEIKDVVKF